jgi:hypothetical protein
VIWWQLIASAACIFTWETVRSQFLSLLCIYATFVRITTRLHAGWKPDHGTWLIGLSLTTGSLVCKQAIPSLGEIAIVGGGQSLSHDSENDRLIISGLASKDNGTTFYHSILTGPLSNPNFSVSGSAVSPCMPLTSIGSFGYGANLPVAHSTEIDVKGQVEICTLSTK